MRPAVHWLSAAALVAMLAAAWTWLGGDPHWGRGASFAIASGTALGVVLQRSRLCFASAIRDVFLFRDRTAAQGLLAALAVGSIGYQIVLEAWVADPKAGYLPPTAHIAPAGWHLLLGGVAFGLGMVVAGGCLSGQLYRLGEGALPATAAIAGAVCGFIGGYRAWNPLYVAVVSSAPVVWLPAHLGYGGALLVQLGLLGAIAAVLLNRITLPAPPPRGPSSLRTALRRVLVEAWPSVAGGVTMGVLASFALLRSQPLGVTAEMARAARALAHVFGMAPERLEGLDLLAGCRAAVTGRIISDSGLFVITLVAGSAVAALLAGEFRVRLGRPMAWVRAFSGGVLMGFGAMISLGCTVGTMLSGIMAFSLSGWVFTLGLIGGAWAASTLLWRLT